MTSVKAREDAWKQLQADVRRASLSGLPKPHRIDVEQLLGNMRAEVLARQARAAREACVLGFTVMAERFEAAAIEASDVAWQRLRRFLP